MCRYVWIYEYPMNIYMCVNVWICEEYACVCIFAHMCIHTFIQIYIYTHFHAWNKVAYSQSLLTNMHMRRIYMCMHICQRRLGICNFIFRHGKVYMCVIVWMYEYTCVYICMNIRIYTCKQYVTCKQFVLCKNVYMYTYVWMCKYAWICKYTPIVYWCIFVYSYIYTHIHILTKCLVFTRVYLYSHAYTYVYMYTCIYVYMYIWTYEYTRGNNRHCTRICICVHMYKYVNTHLDVNSFEHVKIHSSKCVCTYSFEHVKIHSSYTIGSVCEFEYVYICINMWIHI